MSRPASWLALPSRTFRFELSLAGLPQTNVEYDDTGKQSIPTTVLSPASPTALWPAEPTLTPRSRRDQWDREKGWGSWNSGGRVRFSNGVRIIAWKALKTHPSRIRTFSMSLNVSFELPELP